MPQVNDATQFSKLLSESQLKKLEQTFLEDSDFLNEVISAYEINLTQCIAELRSGLLHGDSEKIKRACHRLRGSTLNFADFSVTDRLAEIENQILRESEFELSEAEIAKTDAILHILLMDLKLLAKKWGSSQSPSADSLN